MAKDKIGIRLVHGPNLSTLCINLPTDKKKRKRKGALEGKKETQ